MKRTVADNLLAWYVVSTTLLVIVIGSSIIYFGPATYQFWKWTAQSWQAVGTFAALTGVIGIFFQVVQNAGQQRRETGPYVRVDIGPTSGKAATQFVRPDAYIFLSEDYIDVSGDSGATPYVSISAWLRNYQTHPLGVCFTLRTEFHFIARDPSGKLVIGHGA